MSCLACDNKRQGIYELPQNSGGKKNNLPTDKGKEALSVDQERKGLSTKEQNGKRVTLTTDNIKKVVDEKAKQ